jgi:hypothetical protein
MAVTITPLGGLTGEFRVIHDADCDNTAENDVCDGTSTIYSVTINNDANAALTYVKFYNNAAPTVGTTAPDMVLQADASETVTYTFKDGLAFFTTSLSYAAVTAGGTAGTTSPTSNVLVTMVVE